MRTLEKTAVIFFFLALIYGIYCVITYDFKTLWLGFVFMAIAFVFKKVDEELEKKKSIKRLS